MWYEIMYYHRLIRESFTFVDLSECSQITSTPCCLIIFENRSALVHLVTDFQTLAHANLFLANMWRGSTKFPRSYEGMAICP